MVGNSMNYWFKPYKWTKRQRHITRKNLALEAILKILTGMANLVVSPWKLSFEWDMWIMQKRLGWLDPKYNKDGTRKK